MGNCVLIKWCVDGVHGEEPRVDAEARRCYALRSPEAKKEHVGDVSWRVEIM